MGATSGLVRETADTHHLSDLGSDGAWGWLRPT